MRIAMMSTCATATPPKKYGGTELVVAELAKGMLELGHDVTVYATGDSDVAGRLKHCFEHPMWPPSAEAEHRHVAYAWRDIVSDPEPYDLVHLHQADALSLPWLERQPCVLTVHHHRSDELIELYREHPSVAYVAISRRQAMLAPELEFASIIHHGLDPALYELGAGDGDYVAYLGRFAPEKATHVAIDAARAAGSRIVLGGLPHDVPESRGYFEQEVKPRLSGAGIDWRGELSLGPKIELLTHARALLFPLSWEEPFGLVMIEAMLVGTPVIAFARGSAPEVVEDGVTGFLVRDMDEMAACIGQLHRIDRRRCRARAVARFGTSRMAADYEDLYVRLLSGGRAWRTNLEHTATSTQAGMASR